MYRPSIEDDKFFSITITVYVGGRAVKTFRLEALQFIIELQFIGIMQEILSQEKPMKVVMSRDEIIWDKFEQKINVLPITMEFCNYQEGDIDAEI